ncbi:MAG: hypothetical protein US94_C0007G0001 [Berkelbacteria bacterium GW2011_GWB1_38_5]|uniref:Uncharacterized protein n=1 Tax=Berkelbacteria bacterium GW2011_GWB1_38_5 TaxID=1618336 RepID=A0A0G0MKS7_9BACT|nr:MAG: hypothetical protein US94_C0007G0001 [Berkelbacteria bacterium GW2011_GWB1_38_5]
MVNQKSNITLIVVIIVLAIIAVAGIATATYFWGKSKGNATPSPKISATVTSKVTSTPQFNEESAKQVVENFMKYSLGTLPGAEVNYEKARAYLSDNMKAQYPDDNWVPMLYGIQDGPTSVKFISENDTGDSVVLRYDPTWGEMSSGWAFTLEKDNNKWFITGFSNTAQ